MNVFMACGYLTADPQVITTKKAGVTFARATLAINESVKKADGTWQQHTTFIQLRVWGKAGMTFAGNFAKGTQVMCHGKLRQEQWLDKNGAKQSMLLFVVNQFKGVVNMKRVEEVTSTENSFGPLSADDVNASADGMSYGPPAEEPY
jgi:single-strand DNA-binding protein